MITPFYASLLAFIFVALSVRTLLLRRKLKIGVGAGENHQMLRAMRVHANFSEYVPFALLLSLMIELLNGLTSLVHFVCICLVIGRVLHAYGVSQSSENYNFRVSGMAFTFTSICTSALILIFLTLFISPQ